MMRGANLLLALSFMALGCSGRGGGDTADSSVPGDFLTSVGKGGGFTGLWTGYTVGADGSVLRWSGNGPSAPTEPVGELDSEALARIWDSALAEELMGRSDSGSGNLTGYIRIEAAGKSVDLRWASSVPGFESPSPLERFYATVLREVSPLVEGG